MPPVDQEAARALLVARRTELSAEIASITHVSRDPMAAVGFGKRVGDGTTEAVERLNKIGIHDALMAKAADVDRALVKLDEGSYGECDVCGVAIPAARMEAMPWSNVCVEHAAKR